MMLGRTLSRVWRRRTAGPLFSTPRKLRSSTMKSKGRRMLSNVVRGDFYDMDVLTDGGAVSIDSVVEGEDGEDDGFLVRIAPTSESGEDLSELEEKDEKGLLVRMEGPSLFTHNLATMWRLDAGRADPNDAIAGHLAVMAPISMIDAAIGRVDGGAAKFSERLWKHGIVVDPMSTVDACSTFNILSAEGRNVALATLPAQWPRV